MAAATQLAIGIDLGATKIAGALVTPQGQIVATDRRVTKAVEGTEAVLANLVETINNLLEYSPQPVAGIGIGAPGQVEPKTGIVRNAVNLGWQEVSLVAEVKARLQKNTSIYVQKDANAEALGELYFGAGQGCQNLIYIGVGTGLGGGALTDGRLIIGDTYSASEIGHLSLDPNGRLCQCGLKGCAETVVSGPGVLALTREYLAQKKYDTGLIDSPALHPKDILAAAYRGDSLAQAALAEVARWLSMIMAAYISILNPARIVIGGGVGRAAFELLLPHLETELQKRVLTVSRQKLQIVQSQLVSSAVGASCLVWHQQLKDERGDE